MLYLESIIILHGEINYFIAFWPTFLPRLMYSGH